jgi:hypothetical protein
MHESSFINMDYFSENFSKKRLKSFTKMLEKSRKEIICVVCHIELFPKQLTNDEIIFAIKESELSFLDNFYQYLILY